MGGWYRIFRSFRRMPKMRRVDGEGRILTQASVLFIFRGNKSSDLIPILCIRQASPAIFASPRCFALLLAHSFSLSITQPQPCASLPSSPSSAAPPPSPPPLREFFPDLSVRCGISVSCVGLVDGGRTERDPSPAVANAKSVGSALANCCVVKMPPATKAKERQQHGGVSDQRHFNAQPRMRRNGR